jgi:pimeloyl-ACP methyl ester carboxylesterase
MTLAGMGGHRPRPRNTGPSTTWSQFSISLRYRARSAIAAWPVEDDFVREAEPAFDRLADVRAPTVLMVGDLDRPALIECDEAIAARITGCELIRMPRVDHLPAIREPGLVTQTILRQCGHRPGQ